MRNAIIGIVIGLVLGVVSGATVVAPRLNEVDKINPIIGLAAQKSSRFEKLDKVILPIGKDQKKINIVEKASTLNSLDIEKVQSKKLAYTNTENPRLILGPKTIHWKMASAYPSTLPQLGTLAKKLDHDIWRVSDGLLEVKFHEPGVLVPPLKMFDAVRAGVIDAAFSSPGFWSNKLPALQLFSAIPFGPPADEFLAWIYYGGGQELFNEIYNANGIHSIFCGLIAPEAAGWFRKRIRTVEDLKGLKMRFFGLGAKVAQKLGVLTTQLTSGDIYMAFESGKIDAAEFSIPSTDLKLGLHQMIKNYYFPGWHQPSTMYELMINIEKWKALPASAKAQIEAVCGDNIRQGIAESGGTQFKALKKLQREGVTIRRWPGEILVALKSAWLQVAREEAESDPDFKRVWQSLRDFRKDYAIWHELNLQ
jgi:TRAP-type mannitol/chloroaromatic compound transport system substrate-binding protein